MTSAGPNALLSTSSFLVSLLLFLQRSSQFDVWCLEELGLDWNYLEIAAHVPHAFVDQGQDIAELVLLVGFAKLAPSNVILNIHLEHLGKRSVETSGHQRYSGWPRSICNKRFVHETSH